MMRPFVLGPFVGVPFSLLEMHGLRYLVSGEVAKKESL
jgi:hypothetical protein